MYVQCQAESLALYTPGPQQFGSLEVSVDAEYTRANSTLTLYSTRTVNQLSKDL